MRAISRFQARVEGRSRYFTGAPCERGHIAERNTKHGHCLACAKEASKARDLARRRDYNRRWRAKNPGYAADYYVYYQADYYARKCREKDPNWRPRALRAKIAQESRALLDIARRARKHADRPKRKLPSAEERTLCRLWRHVRGRRGCNFTKADLAAVLRAALRAGTVIVDPTPYRNGPDVASVDQVIGGLGYGLPNIRIVPLWLNLAKNQWDELEVEAAIERWRTATFRG